MQGPNMVYSQKVVFDLGTLSEGPELTHKIPNRLNFTELQRSNNMIYIKTGIEHFFKKM